MVTVAEKDDFLVEKTKNIYETFYAECYTRSNIDERLPFVLGDATWLWDSAEVSYSGDRSAVDVPVSGGFVYKVYKKSQNGEYIAVSVSSKIVAVQDAQGNTSFYIRVSISDVGENSVVNQTLNFEDRNGYNGLEYYIAIDGCPIAIAKFENGTQIDGVFLGDTDIDKVGKYCKFAYLLGDIAVARISNTTRSYLDTEDHNAILNNLEYQIFLRTLFPDMSSDFYEKIQYAGCAGIVRNMGSSGMIEDIKRAVNNTIYKAKK